MDRIGSNWKTLQVMLQMFRCNILILFALYLSLSGCKLRAIPEPDIPGKYRADYLRSGEVKENGWEVLELFPDGKFIQEINLNGKTYTASGTWKYDKKTKYLYFWRLRKALLWDDKDNPNIGESPDKETLGTSISRTIDGKITFGMTEDIDYIKISK